MLNSVLLLGSTYNQWEFFGDSSKIVTEVEHKEASSRNNKNKKVNIIFAIVWIIFMLLGSNLKTGLIFTIMNFMSFCIIFILGQVLKGKYSNKIFSISSILIWSVIIDVICYFLYPQFTMGQNILTYIGNGILFNYKYIFYNIFLVSVIYSIRYLANLKAVSKAIA